MNEDKPLGIYFSRSRRPPEFHLTLKGRNIFDKEDTWRLQIEMIEAKTFRTFIRIYCGVEPKGRSIDRPLLINGYTSSSGFIGNDCKPMQRQLRNIGNILEVHFLGNGYNRPCLGNRFMEKLTH
jgi:hypothetical protein